MSNKRQITNMGASVRQRLLNFARAKGEDFGQILIRFAAERLIYRLSKSPYADRFVLKGAMLFALWNQNPHRATRDIDMLADGYPTPAEAESIFQEVCQCEVEDDGISFTGVEAQEIREGQDYRGVRVTIPAVLDQARIIVQIDIGFGDVVVPDPCEEMLPGMLDFPTGCLKVYPKEAVIAEKFEAMVSLGMANSRMKDFYDIYVLAKSFSFEGALLSRAIAATFARRKTMLPATTPLALLPEFSEDRLKQTQWLAFMHKSRLAQDASLTEVAEILRSFLMPPAQAALKREAFKARWPASGPWQG